MLIFFFARVVFPFIDYLELIYYLFYLSLFMLIASPEKSSLPFEDKSLNDYQPYFQ
jgi:hypothetical protein